MVLSYYNNYNEQALNFDYLVLVQDTSLSLNATRVVKEGCLSICFCLSICLELPTLSLKELLKVCVSQEMILAVYCAPFAREKS